MQHLKPFKMTGVTMGMPIDWYFHSLAFNKLETELLVTALRPALLYFLLYLLRAAVTSLSPIWLLPYSTLTSGKVATSCFPCHGVQAWQTYTRSQLEHWGYRWIFFFFFCHWDWRFDLKAADRWKVCEWDWVVLSKCHRCCPVAAWVRVVFEGIQL